MGGTRSERDVAAARTAYIAAGRRFTQAIATFITVGVPIDPGSNPSDVKAWNRLDVAVALELHAALGDLIKTRRGYDRIRRH